MASSGYDDQWESVPTGIIDEEDLPTRPTSDLPQDVPFLVVLTGDSPGHQYPVDKQVVIGRSTQATIQLSTENVSRLHARITHDKSGEYVIEDLGSRNGTQVNDMQIERHTLQEGDRIQIGGGTIFRFTHRSPLEEKFLQAQKLESIGRLAGGIAHDFNNLMASLLADIRYLQGLAAQGNLPADEALECLSTMEQAARRSVELTRQLLGFAQGGKYASTAVNLSALIEVVLEFLGRAFGHDIQVETQLEANLVVRGDRAQLQQVLINICLNARDAMPDGGKLTICGSTTHLDGARAVNMSPLAAGHHVLVTIQDSGTGMDEPTRKRAFEPYFTTKDVGKGSGLGLAAAYGIVNNHGGLLQLDSQLDQGTTVRIYLPASREPA